MHTQTENIKPNNLAPRFQQSQNVARTMSSLEIADLTGKRHDNVKRTIEDLAAAGLVHPQIEDGQTQDKIGRGRAVVTLNVGERDSYVIVARLSPEFTSKLVDRWLALESAPAALVIPKTLPEALRLAADLAEQNSTLRLVVEEQAPKVVALARIADATGTMCMTDAAKHLNVPRKHLIDWMKLHRWIYRRDGSARWVAYQPRQQAGLLDHKVTVIGLEENGDQRLASQVRITPKGLTVLAEKLQGGNHGR